MKLLIIDTKWAHALDFAMRAQSDGHDVRWFVPEFDKTEHFGEGLVQVIRDFSTSIRWADLIVLTDNTSYLRFTDKARKIGCAVVGPTQETSDWELDRTKGMDVLEKHGIQVPAFQEFDNYDAAIAYVKKHDRPFVSKPSGDADKALSYVAKTPADMVFMLERWKKGNKIKAPFILQEKIDGIEMAIGGWFGPGGFNRGWCENFEFKKLCVGDLGCATGEQGTVLRYVRKSKLADKMLKPLTDALLREEYTGYVDVNTIIDEKGQAWPLEFTMRPGWPTFSIQMELHEGDCVDWLMELTEGMDAGNVRMDEIAVGVVLSIPDYPYSHITRKEVVGIPVYGLTPELLEHIHPCGMMMVEAPDLETLKPTKVLGTAGDYVLIMSACGATVRESQRLAYARLKELNVPNNPMYRTDIGDRLKKQLPKLQAHGYALGMNYAAEKKREPEKPENSMKIGDMKVIYV